MRINDRQVSPGDMGSAKINKQPVREEETVSSEPKDLVTRSEGETVKLTILHTNDLHGHTHSFKEGKNEQEGEVGGLSQVASVIREEKAEDPKNTLLLDAGDITSGGPVSDYFKAIPMVDAMNNLGYDAMVIGNHEFDAGRDAMKNVANRAAFPILSANLVDNTPGKALKVRPYIMKEVNGLKVGILGLTTPETKTMLNQEDVKNINFASAADTAKRMIPQMKKEGADLVVVLSHLGFNEDKELAGRVDGIDVIIGGHSHTELAEPVEVNGTVITQAGSFGKNVGKLELDITRSGDRAKVTGAHSRLIRIDTDSIKPDRAVNRVLKKYTEQVESLMGRIIGRTDTPLSQRDYHIYKEESPLGNFITDSLRKKSGTDIFVLSPSSLRSNIGAGEIKVGDVHQVFPWDNKVAVLKMKGKDIKTVLEELISGPAHSFIASGMKVNIDTRKPEGKKIISIKTPDGKRLDPEKLYSVGTRDWFADGNVGLVSFKKAVDRKDTRDMREMLIEKIEETPVIMAKLDGRIKNIGSSEVGLA